MRAIDADALIADLEYDVERDAKALDSIDSVGRDWETIWFDKNCKQNAIDLLQHAPTIEPRCETCEAFNKTRLLIPQPQRKKGMWIDSHTTCSECGWQMIDDVIESPNMVAFNFCPNCGADMREPEDIPMEYFESGGGR